MNKIIYGLIAVAIVLVVCAMISVANTIDISRSKAKVEDASPKWYSNPSSLGGFWTVEQNGIKIEHVRCIYWSSTDGYSVFETEEGKIIFVNGSSVVCQE